ncbi:hypothetical protein KFE25_005344 [Diacronema lutheri]|uniref:Uncharacterized protein n=1 Tax=Diacronema lutheri TaxID=2081491 RepID=A0A8J6CAR0_DIALT|nr:hypothetical protein KFE25_005344 [Diacronema lutheri]
MSVHDGAESPRGVELRWHLAQVEAAQRRAAALFEDGRTDGVLDAPRRPFARTTASPPLAGAEPRELSPRARKNVVPRLPRRAGAAPSEPSFAGSSHLALGARADAPPPPARGGTAGGAFARTAASGGVGAACAFGGAPSRDVSYLQDASPRAQLRGLSASILSPESRLPLSKREAQQLLPVLPATLADGAAWDAAADAWRVPSFPSPRPSGRREVELLRVALNEMVGAIARANGVPADGASLRELLRASSSADRLFGELHAVYATGAHELARQVGTHIAERGQLLAHVWDAHVELCEHMMAAKDEQLAALGARARLAEAARDAALERAAAIAGVEQALASKATELAQMTVSRDKLVALTRSLQTAVKRADAAAHRHQLVAREADGVLAAWLPHWQHFHSAGALRALQRARERRLGEAGGTRAAGAAESAQARAQLWHHALQRHLVAAAEASASAAAAAAARARRTSADEGNSLELPPTAALPAQPDGLGLDAAELLLRDTADMLCAVMGDEALLHSTAPLGREDAEGAAAR